MDFLQKYHVELAMGVASSKKGKPIRPRRCPSTEPSDILTEKTGRYCVLVEWLGTILLPSSRDL